jgi:hypothetical protein
MARAVAYNYHTHKINGKIMYKHDKTTLKNIETAILKYPKKEMILEEPSKVYFFAYIKFDLSLTISECNSIWANCLIQVN